jgi:2-polyprenyl-3-methyl-5-hydroxy-6-metoxy-1,4-benzoquinol methylase
MSTTAENSNIAELSADAFAERLFGSALGAFETFSVYVGERMGWYRSLADDGPATSAELAARTGCQERYVREWLEQQAVYDILVAVGGGADRSFELPPAAREVLLDEHSLVHLGPLPRIFAAIGANLPQLMQAYRVGGGVSWDDLGDNARESQAALNRPWFEGQLSTAIAGVPAIHDILSRPGARIADVGCGAGWSTIGLAKAYPGARLEGFDVDGPSVDMARLNAGEAGVGDRVVFHHTGGEHLATMPGEFDAAFAFECVHDMPHPVDVLAAMRGAVRPDGAVVIVDENVADEFTAPGDEVERFMYGCSVFVCLPDGLSAPDSVGTGTVMRRGIVEDYAARAGYAGVSVLPIEDFSFFRFYRLLA